MSEADALTLLTHAIDYTYGESQKRARTREDHEDFTITLRLLGLLRDGWATGPWIFDVACGYAVGLYHKKYLRRRAERAEFERLELLRCIPDYDYSKEPRIADRDPTDGRRHYGNRFRHLAAQRISRDEPIPSRNPHEDFQAAGERFGDRPTAYDPHSAPNRAGAPDFTARPVADRRSAPKRLSSPAQARLEARFRAAQRVVYFGA
jgi:hypothetical protein